MTNTVSGPYAPTNWVSGVTAANQTRMNNLELQSADALNGFNGDLLAPFLLSGMVCTKDGTTATQFDVTSGRAYLTMSDGTRGLIIAGASTPGQFTTSTPSTTYYLFLKNDGTYQWSTSSSGPANSLALCQATTDGSGNILVVTDKRVTTPSVLSGASTVQFPGIAATRPSTLDNGLIATDGLGTFSGQAPSTPAAPALTAVASAGTPYRTQLLASSPIRYYRLDETSGTVATDSGSQAQNGTYSAATLNQTGLLTGDTDAAATFNGTTSTVSLPTTSLPTGNTAWSIACLVKPTNSTNGANGVIAAIGNPGTNGAAGYLAQASAGGWIAGTWGGGVHDSAAQDASVAGHTYFLAITYDGAGNLRLYVADITLGTTTPTVYGPFAVGTLALTAGHANIGLAHTTVDGFWFAGTIDEVAIFSSALSAGTLTTLYQIAYGGPGANALPGVGTYQYGVTFASAVSETANSTPASISTTANNQKMSLTAIPTGPTGTTKRNLYRTILGGSALQLLATLSDNTATTYTDQIADNALGIALPAHPTAGGDIWKNAAGTTVAQVYGDGYANLAGLTGALPSVAGQATVGALGVAVPVAQANGVAVNVTTDQTILIFTAPVDGWYRASMSCVYINGTSQKFKANIHWIDPSGAGFAINSFTSALDGMFLNGSQASTPGTNQTIMMNSLTFRAKGGQAFGVHFQDPGGTPTDTVNVLIERLT